MRERPPSTGGGTLIRLSTAAQLNRSCAILTISASSATLIRRTFFSRHPARLGSRIAARGDSQPAYSIRERRTTMMTAAATSAAAAAAAAAAPDAEDWTDRKSEETSYANELVSYLLRTSGDGRRERHEDPAESEGDSPRTLLRTKLFSASIRFHRRRNMRATTPPTAPGDDSDGGGPKNRRRLLLKRWNAAANNVRKTRNEEWIPRIR